MVHTYRHSLPIHYYTDVCIYASFSRRNSIKDSDLSELQMPEKARENLLNQFLLEIKIDTDINWTGRINLCYGLLILLPDQFSSVRFLLQSCSHPAPKLFHNLSEDQKNMFQAGSTNQYVEHSFEIALFCSYPRSLRYLKECIILKQLKLNYSRTNIYSYHLDLLLEFYLARRIHNVVFQLFIGNEN